MTWDRLINRSGAISRPPTKRYKKSEKIDIEDPTTWTKGQLRCALSACGMPNVKGIKAPGREGQQQLARLVAQFWAFPNRKLFAQKAAVNFVGEGFDPSPLSSAPVSWGSPGAEARGAGGGGGGGEGFLPPGMACF